MTTKYITDLRLIAIFSMLIDHIGLIFFPTQIIFRLIGRLAFPLFAWGITQGAIYTQNWPKYALRLFVFALISQYPFYLFTTIVPHPLAKTNVVFTLLFGLLAIQIYKAKKFLIYKLCFYFLLFAICYYLDPDYGFAGVLTVLFVYIFNTNFPALFISQLIIFSFPVIENWIIGSLVYSSTIVLVAPFAFFLTLLPSVKPFPKLKYLFYLIYPIQFLIIYFLKILKI